MTKGEQNLNDGQPKINLTISRTFEASLLSTTNKSLCSSLEIPCGTDMKNMQEIAINPAEFVWFEDGRRHFEDDLPGETDQTTEVNLGVDDFVWFKDADEESKHKYEILSNLLAEGSLSEQLETVLKSKEDIGKEVEEILRSKTNMII